MPDNTPRTNDGFAAGTFAAAVLGTGPRRPVPEPPGVWNVSSPRDLVPLHRYLLRQATGLARSADTASPDVTHWSHAARVVADLEAAWPRPARGSAQQTAPCEAAEQALSAVRDALEHSADAAAVECRLLLAAGWTAQLRMSAAPQTPKAPKRERARWLPGPR
uniref:hypothetical protein n=1 Tax=Amycolatopsis sp. CA-096443 TaxID=3239919 RepID=UPI003F49291A